MLSIKTDLHTHTIASGHAYSTLEENIISASTSGIEVLGVADHFSGLFFPNTDFSNYWSFMNYNSVPRKWHGVYFLHGAEVDIVDLDGHLFGHNLYADLPAFSNYNNKTYEEIILSKMDYLIASIHDSSFTKGATISETTKMYCNALEHPKVKIIGHIGRVGVPFDIDEVLLTAKQLNKMIEINNTSLTRHEHIVSKCKEIAIRCAELGVMIAVNSDAHSAHYVGKYDEAIKMLEEIHFPEKLIGNRDFASLKKILGLNKLK